MAQRARDRAVPGEKHAMKKRLALCSVVSLAFCGASLAQSGEREAARTPAASAGCQALTGAERDRCLKRKTTKTARKSSANASVTSLAGVKSPAATTLLSNLANMSGNSSLRHSLPTRPRSIAVTGSTRRP